MTKRPKASLNKAKDVVTKRIAIPDVAKAEIIRMNQNFERYLFGVVAGMGIKSRWSVDVKTMQFIVEDKVDE